MLKRTIVAAVAVAALLALAGCGTTVVPSPDGGMLDTVTARGVGETLAPPDTARLTFGSSASDPDAGQALATVSETAEAIAAAARENGVAADDIQTADVSVYPEYAQREGESPRVTGYRAQISVRVKVRDLATVGEVISAASDAGATEINGPIFTLEEDDEVTAEAISLAVEDARRRAEAMASSSGKALGEVRIVTEDDISIPLMDRSRHPVNYSIELEASVPIETGSLDVTARVTVVFSLE